MLRIGVCDDDKEFRQRLVQMIRIWSDHSGIPTELYPFDNGDELISKTRPSAWISSCWIL